MKRIELSARKIRGIHRKAQTCGDEEVRMRNYFPFFSRRVISKAFNRRLFFLCFLRRFRSFSRPRGILSSPEFNAGSSVDYFSC